MRKNVTTGPKRRRWKRRDIWRSWSYPYEWDNGGRIKYPVLEQDDLTACKPIEQDSYWTPHPSDDEYWDYMAMLEDDGFDYHDALYDVREDMYEDDWYDMRDLEDSFA
jgi:hypothetical protein